MTDPEDEPDPVEPEPPTEEDVQTEEEDDDSPLDTAREGLVDLGLAVRDVPRNPFVLTGKNRTHLLQASLVLLVASLAMLLAYGFAGPAGEDESGGPLRFLLHPIVAPALVLGFALRSGFAWLRDEAGPGVSELEAEDAWERFRPLLAAVWLAAAVSVTLFTAARLLAVGQLNTLALVEDASQNLVVCLWIVPAVAIARDLDSGINEVVQAGVGALLAFIGMEIALFVASLGTRFVWSLIGGMLPDLPERLVVIGRALTEIGAELGFLVYLLGFTWAKSRERYVAWATSTPDAAAT